MNKKTIWLEEQNKPTLVVEDITKAYPCVDSGFVYFVLLRRGIFKWLSVRRDLIKFKDLLKDCIKILNKRKTDYEKGYLKAIEFCRKEIRAMCHSERWRCPDFDSRANRWLSEFDGEEVK